MLENNKKKILLISMQGIGDLILLTPALSLLKKTIPNSSITLLVLAHMKDIAAGNPDVDEVVSYDTKKDRGFVKIIALVAGLRKKRFDVSICAYPTGLRSALLGYLSGAKIRVGQKLYALRNFPFLFNEKVEVNEVKHAVEMNIDLVKAIGANPEAVKRELVLPLTASQREAVQLFRKEADIGQDDIVICIHAGAGKWGKSRLWPEKYFSELADGLYAKYAAKIIFIGGKDEQDVISRIISGMRGNPVVFFDKSLLLVAALIESCTLFIGNNSGPMHISAAVKTLTIGLFGDTDPRIHSPFGDGNLAVRSRLDCSPCYYPHLHGTLECAKIGKGVVNKKFVCEKKNFACMQAISVDEVMRAADSLLGGKTIKHEDKRY